MMYVNQFRREERYQVIVLDCAPTAESLRFISMPTTLDWYMKHIFPFHRGLLKAVRPIANRVSPVELPTDNYFANIADLFEKMDGSYAVRLKLPFAAKGEIGLFKKGDELVVEVGTLRRHIGLPTSMAGLAPTKAHLHNKILTVEMKEAV